MGHFQPRALLNSRGPAQPGAVPSPLLLRCCSAKWTRAQRAQLQLLLRGLGVAAQRIPPSRARPRCLCRLAERCAPTGNRTDGLN